MKIYEYNEGKQAQKNFEQGMKALFQVPKDAVPAKKKSKKTLKEQKESK